MAQEVKLKLKLIRHPAYNAEAERKVPASPCDDFNTGAHLRKSVAPISAAAALEISVTVDTNFAELAPHLTPRPQSMLLPILPSLRVRHDFQALT